MHILLVDDKVPDPNFGAGFPRAYRLLLTFVELGYKISFYPTNRNTVPSINKDKLKLYNISIPESIRELEDVDVAIISRPHNMHYHLPVVQKHHKTAKTIYDTEALWYRRYDLQMQITGRLPWWAYRYDELGLANKVDMCFVVNDEEKAILEQSG